MWLKRWTPQNIVIGGAAGALPPIIGEAVCTGTVSLDSLILFAIIFLWTPPHFWALALLKTDDYARAGVPMMPNAKGAARTRLEILLYTLLLAPVAVLPWVAGFASPVYGIVAILGGVTMSVLAFRVFRRREEADAARACGQLFGISILYLFALFGLLVVERTLHLTMGG